MLSAFEIIMKDGEKTDAGRRLEGIEASTDYDGYNVYLKGNGVELHIGFHNTYNLTYDHEHLKEKFMAKIDALTKPQINDNHH